jgi:hypothetical protein
MRIRINGLNWTVQNVAREDDRLILDDSVCLGITYCKDLNIFMDEELPITLYRQTLIHELVHAFIFSFGVHVIADEDDTEEFICDFIGAHLDDIYRLTNKIISKLYRKGV